MSVKKLSQETLKKAWEYATKNTKYNEQGQAVISTDDDDFEEEWIDKDKEGNIVTQDNKDM